MDFENYNITVETPFTVENWQEVMDASKESMMTQVWNIMFMLFLENSLDLGWDVEKEGLGSFVAREAAEETPDDIIELIGTFLWHDKEMIELLDRYGEAYHRDDCKPMIVFRDKETGEIDPLGSDGFFDDFLAASIMGLFDDEND